ncbi:hypothetical protein ABZ801_27765 [Actinomadura sp. NPDC047616]|uniref:tyrosine-type recombinase/integrase n=1 Tax=Actinomadura sp. NPDC047616 TaxID=3155914 RepID=UPI0033E3753C
MEVLAQLRAPGPEDAGSGLVTVGEWLTHWLATRTRASSTVRGYASHVRLYLDPYLGTILLAELSASHVQAMFTAIARQHEVEGKPVTPATLNRIRATVRAALNAAIRQGLITDNPASRAELPAARRPRAVVWTSARVEHWQRTGEQPPVAVWTAAQTAEFLHAIRDHRLYAVFHLIALRGLRRGEAAGLRDPAGRWVRHESRPGDAAAVVDIDRRRHLHQPAAAAGQAVGRGRRRRDPQR